MKRRGLGPNERAPGTRVRLTGRFLRDTGQIAGDEGSRVWTIVACDCAICRRNDDEYAVVAVDEPHACQSDPRGYEDIAVDERPRWRHIHAGNLQVVGGKPKVTDYP